MVKVTLPSNFQATDQVRRPTWVAVGLIILFAFATAIVPLFKDDDFFQLIVYVTFLVFGTAVAAFFYRLEVTALLNPYFPAVNRIGDSRPGLPGREDLHKAIQEASGRCAEVAAAVAIALFALGVIRPYLETRNGASVQTVRSAYGPVFKDTGAVWYALCAKFVGTSLQPDPWCKFLSDVDRTDVDKYPLAPRLYAEAEKVSPDATGVSGRLLSLASRADAIEKSPMVQGSRASLRTSSTVAKFLTALWWVPFVGGYSLALAAALKIGRAFAERRSIRAGKPENPNESEEEVLVAHDVEDTAPAAGDLTMTGASRAASVAAVGLFAVAALAYLVRRNDTRLRN